MLFRIFFWILCFCVVTFGLPMHKIEGKCVQPKEFNKNQRQVIIKAFKYGAKSGFGYTMAAIAWKESCAGEYRINFADPSAGIYHAYIPGLIKKHKHQDTNFVRNMIGELLIRDDDFASKSALEELEYWHKIRKGNWYEIIKSYNKGFSWEKDKTRDKMANAYFEDVSNRVKILQSYIPKITSVANKIAQNDYAIAFLQNSSSKTMPNHTAPQPKTTPKAIDSQNIKPYQKSQNNFVILEE